MKCIVKEEHNTEYFQMNNAPIQDPCLSWEAKGLLAYGLYPVR
jgi:hypothetical protein